MSTRYVWGKYTEGTPSYEYDSSQTLSSFSYYYSGQLSGDTVYPPIADCGSLLGTGGYPETDDPHEAWFSIDSARESFSNNAGTYTSDRNFLVPKDSNAIFRKQPYYSGSIVYGKIALSRTDSSASWKIVYSPTRAVVTCETSTGATKSFKVYKNPTKNIPKGDYLEDVTSSSGSRFPQDGPSSGYYYVYKGSDNIDPTTVSYSKQNIQPGDSVTITATPRTPTYGGTVYYQFAYSLDGGTSWANIGSKTTATSVSVTVPALANQFRARVVASDDLGFTSSSYIYGQNFVLNEAPTAPAYVTVPETVYIERPFLVSWAASSDPDGNLTGYEVEVAYDGSSSWSSIATSVTETSVTDVVAGLHTSVRYRVRAKDAHGLVSAWTNSSSAFVGEINAYIGVNGKARSITKIYVGVSGKAREVVKGYIGVSGKAKRVL